MVLNTKKFLALLARFRVEFATVANELDLKVAELTNMLRRNEMFNLEQSKKLLSMFGADELYEIIRWEAVHVACYC